jgi:hypothetical protein
MRHLVHVLAAPREADKVTGFDLVVANKGCDLRLIQDYLGHKQIHYVPRRTMSR